MFVVQYYLKHQEEIQRRRRRLLGSFWSEHETPTQSGQASLQLL